MKNWTGNKSSTFVTLGANNHCEHDRANYDFYATDPIAIDLLLNKCKELNIDIAPNIWECATGNGHLAKKLKKNGYNVLSSDIIERDYKLDSIQNFLKFDGTTKRDIITNPPYKYAQEFVEKGMQTIENGKLFLLLKLTFLEGQKRKEMFKKHPPKYVLVFSKRIQCAINGDEEVFKKSSASCYAWFIWEKGYSDKPIIDWI